MTIQLGLSLHIMILVLCSSTVAWAKLEFNHTYSSKNLNSRKSVKKISWNPYQSYELNDGIRPQPSHQEQRKPAALPLILERPKKPKKVFKLRNEGWNLQAQAVLLSRNIQVEDRNGAQGDIGVNPSMGLAFASEYLSNDIGFEILGEYLRDEFKPDANVDIQQHTDKKINIQATVFARFEKSRWGLGMGLATLPGFYTTNPTLLSVKHILVPYVRFAGGCQMSEGNRWQFSSLLALDYFLGAEVDGYSFDPGAYKISMALNADYPLSEQSSFVSQVQVFYQDDNPKFHIQTEIGFQLSFGVRWNLGTKGVQP